MITSKDRDENEDDCLSVKVDMQEPFQDKESIDTNNIDKSKIGYQEFQGIESKVRFRTISLEDEDEELLQPTRTKQGATLFETLQNPHDFPAAVQAKYLKDKSIVDLFNENAALHPDLIAATFENISITYKTLNEQSNQLAHHLTRKGVKAEVLVPICIERGINMIVGILGILKAGAAYVPIDPAYPSDRIEFIIKDVSATVVVVSNQSLTKFSQTLDVDFIALERDRNILAPEPLENISTPISPWQLAYVIYTSGSTGKPKGVLIEHRNVVSLFKPTNPLYDFDKQDVWTMFHSYCFDFSVWEVFGALLFGGRLVIVPEMVTKDVYLFAKLLVEEKVTVLNQTPSAFYVLQDYIAFQKEPLKIRFVIFGGEALNPSKLKTWKIQYPQCKLINMYGITETTVHVTYQEIGMQEIESGVSIIGKPIPTLDILLLDDTLQLVNNGEVGELYISGAGLARGYLNRPELTKERFIKNPFGLLPTDRLYKTGDLACRLEDGSFKYIGRIDNQVKIRGYRIELGEIENVMLQSGLVQNAVVVVKEDVESNKLLIAYFISIAPTINDELASYVKQNLPAHMVPAKFISLTKMPLTSNGKIDRKGLSELVIEQAHLANSRLCKTATEKRMEKIWRKILVSNHINATDDFFDLGGSSIQAARIFAIINKEFSITLPVSRLVEAPTIEKLSILVEGKEIASESSIIVPFRTTGSRTPLFFFHAGAGNVLFYKDLADRLEPDRPIYGVSARGLNGKEVPHQKIEDMASDYINEITKIQTTGPYLLAGYCFGAMLAYEIALQLNKKGKQIGLLASLNGISPQYKALQATIPCNNSITLAKPERGLAGKISYHKRIISSLSAKEKLLYPLKTIYSKRYLYAHFTKYYCRRMMYNLFLSLKRPLPTFLAQQYYFDTNWLISKAYNPSSNNFNIVIFRSPAIFPEPTLGWKNYVTGKIETINVPGYHENRRAILTEPHVSTLALLFKKHLQKVEDCLAIFLGCVFEVLSNL